MSRLNEIMYAELETVQAHLDGAVDLANNELQAAIARCVEEIIRLKKDAEGAPFSF